MATDTDESKIQIQSEITIQSEIPTGSWTLYFHSPEETKWTLNTETQNIKNIRN